MRDLGHVEGQNIVFEYRDAKGEVDRLPELAADLVRLGLTIIVAATAPATRAAMGATASIPIVVVAVNYDPVALGYIDSIARPGANITGLYFQHLELLAKRFGLFKEMLPSVSRVALVSDSSTSDQLKAVEAANQSVGFQLQLLDLQNLPYDFESAFRVAMRSRAEAIFVLEFAPHLPRTHSNRTACFANSIADELCVSRIRRGRWPRLLRRELLNQYRRAAEYADKILRGTNAGELPVGAVHQIRACH